MWWILAGCLGAIALLGIGIAAMPKEQVKRKARFEIPEQITPFTVLGLLKDIETNNGLSTKKKEELSTSINRIETYYFGEANGDDEPKLAEIAKRWVRQAKA